MRTDSAIRGRVMGIYLTVFLGGAPLGSPLIGWLSNVNILGIRHTMGLCGAITVVAAAVTYLIFRNKLTEPNSYAIADVLESTYDNK